MKVNCAIDSIRKLKAEAIRDILAKDKKKRFLLLDVRQPYEYEHGHINKAMFIPLAEIKNKQKQIPKDRIIITYCRTGHRSVAAAIKLHQLGYSNLLHMEGGISSWPYETVTGYPEIIERESEEKTTYHDIYMQGMAIELGFRSAYYVHNKKAIDRVKRAVVNVLIPKKRYFKKDAEIENLLLLFMKLEKASKMFLEKSRTRIIDPQVKEIYQNLIMLKDKNMRRIYSTINHYSDDETVKSVDEFEQELSIEHYVDSIMVNPFVCKEYDVTDDIETVEVALEKQTVMNDLLLQTTSMVKDRDTKDLFLELADTERMGEETLINLIEKIIHIK
jgi:rhodanese-related sulfurtransferase